MSPLAAIAYSAHDKAFLTAIQAAGVSVYTLTQEGKLNTIHGPRCDRIAGIQASHVVWIGVPKKWVGKLGSLPFKSEYVESRRWCRVRDPLRAVEKIREVTKMAYDEAVKDRKQREKEHTDRVSAARRAALTAPPPFYVPQELR